MHWKYENTLKINKNIKCHITFQLLNLFCLIQILSRDNTILKCDKKMFETQYPFNDIENE